MSEYIEKKGLIRQITCDMDNFIGTPDDVQKHDEQCNYAISMIEDASIADVAPVVRCKDCKYLANATVNSNGFLICHATGMEISPEDFCSYAEEENVMDAVKFIEERTRMCESFGDRCTGCPASNACNDNPCGCAVGQESTLDATDQVAMVAEWSAAHPRKTRQSVFLGQYPDAMCSEDGVLAICPTALSSAYRGIDGSCTNSKNRCIDCRRKFWMQEVE